MGPRTLPEVFAEVWGFAERNGVAEHLPGVLGMTARVFPEAEEAVVYLQKNAEQAGDGR